MFQQRYRAVIISDNAQLIHISRYIHLNPADYQRWLWSSLPYYRGEQQADWLHPEIVLSQFKDKADYLQFVDEYKDRHDELEAIKRTLADA